jgi:hypothetical protein
VIKIWSIQGFDPYNDIPDPPIPDYTDPNAASVYTHSAWGLRFDLLASLATPGDMPYYMRFDIYSNPAHRPLLAFGNGEVVWFWDLQSLEEGRSAKKLTRKKGKPTKAKTINAKSQVTPLLDEQHDRERSVPMSLHSEITTEPASAELEQDGYTPDYLWMHDPFKPIKPHKEILLWEQSTKKKKVNSPLRKRFFIRACSFSPGGEWIAFASDNQQVVFCKRWMDENHYHPPSQA